MLRVIPVTLLLCAAMPAAAGELRDLCPDRPGLGTPACTLDPGHVQLEVGLVDWTRDDDGGTRTDTILAGDALLRIGLTDRMEAQIGWTSFGHVRERDRLAGTVSNASRVGDASVAIRWNLKNPDGSGTSIAVMPHADLPIGRAPLGAGDWGAGLLVPLSFELPAGLSLALTPGIAAAADADGDGRHLAYGSVVGLGFAFGDSVSASAELGLTRDRDPAGHSTQALGGFSLGWQPADDWQIDTGINVGLNAETPDSEVYLGVSRRF